MSTQTQAFDIADLPADRGVATRNNRKLIVCVLAALGWLGGAAETSWWPALDDWPYTRELLIIKLLLAALSAAIGIAGWRHTALAKADATQAGSTRLQSWLHVTPWLLALSIVTTIWEVVTAQLEWLPRPFFAPPQALIAVFADDLPRLASSVAHSFVLLAYGYACGALTGFLIGVSIDWSKAVGYWLHPDLAARGTLARYRVVTACILLLSVELQCKRVPDCAGVGFSSRGAHVVGRCECELGVLRRCQDARRPAVFPDSARCDSCGLALCLRGAIHGSRCVVRGVDSGIRRSSR
ncbi:hypothetical protein QFZ39_005162 [Paraburkholderia graminis]|nr:hypothetical protein [Paraburkholderia graminis]